MGSSTAATPSLIAGGNDISVDAPYTDGDDVDDMPVADLRVAVRQLRAENAYLRAKVITLEARIANLELLMNV